MLADMTSEAGVCFWCESAIRRILPNGWWAHTHGQGNFCLRDGTPTAEPAPDDPHSWTKISSDPEPWERRIGPLLTDLPWEARRQIDMLRRWDQRHPGAW